MIDIKAIYTMLTGKLLFIGGILQGNINKLSVTMWLYDTVLEFCCVDST